MEVDKELRYQRRWKLGRGQNSSLGFCSSYDTLYSDNYSNFCVDNVLQFHVLRVLGDNTRLTQHCQSLLYDILLDFCQSLLPFDTLKPLCNIFFLVPEEVMYEFNVFGGTRFGGVEMLDIRLKGSKESLDGGRRDRGGSSDVPTRPRG